MGFPTTPRPLGPADLLGAWEDGRGEAMAARALTMLGRALPASDRGALADLPIGQRDALLLQLRALSFGPTAECLSRCPACDATIEFPVSIPDLVVQDATAAEGSVDWRGIRLRIRPATTRDQLSLTGMTDAAAMAGALLQRCAARSDAPAAESRDVPGDAADAVAAEMARLDPGADLRFTLTCPECGVTWSSIFDVVSFLWREIDAAARRLLADVHTLASAYGWSEGDILALSPARRRVYLQLAGS
jgi:hypothetical protein